MRYLKYFPTPNQSKLIFKSLITTPLLFEQLATRDHQKMKILILYARNFKLIIYRRLQGICSIVEHSLTVLSPYLPSQKYTRSNMYKRVNLQYNTKSNIIQNKNSNGKITNNISELYVLSFFKRRNRLLRDTRTKFNENMLYEIFSKPSNALRQ